MDANNSRWIALPVVGAAVGLSFLAAVALPRYGSFASALGALEGRPILLDRYLIDLGKLAPAGYASADVRISNHSNRRVRILGAKASCVCVLPDDLPKEIPPGGAIPFRVRVRLNAKAMEVGVFNHAIDLYTDCPGDRMVRLRIGGEIVPTLTN